MFLIIVHLVCMFIEMNCNKIISCISRPWCFLEKAESSVVLWCHESPVFKAGSECALSWNRDWIIKWFVPLSLSYYP